MHPMALAGTILILSAAICTGALVMIALDIGEKWTLLMVTAGSTVAVVASALRCISLQIFSGGDEPPQR